jgi:hypothetical protein
VVATTGGVLELHSWDRGSGTLTQLTSRREGTVHGTIDPAGEWIWWFDDASGDEHGVWVRQPFGAAPGVGVEKAAALSPAYSSGLALGRDGLAVIGETDDGYGTRLQVVAPGTPERVIYEHTEDAGVGGLRFVETRRTQHVQHVQRGLGVGANEARRHGDHTLGCRRRIDGGEHDPRLVVGVDERPLTRRGSRFFG